VSSRRAVALVAEVVEFAYFPFGHYGQVGLRDGEVGEAFDGAQTLLT
jgi:hypothetical protein